MAKLFFALAYDTNNKSSKQKNLRIEVRNAVIIKTEIVFSEYEALFCVLSLAKIISLSSRVWMKWKACI